MIATRTLRPVARKRLTRRPNLPCENALLRSLQHSLDLLDEVSSVHGAACCCNLCQEFRGVQLLLGVASDLIANWLLPVKDDAPAGKAVTS